MPATRTDKCQALVITILLTIELVWELLPNSKAFCGISKLILQKFCVDYSTKYTILYSILFKYKDIGILPSVAKNV